MRVVFHKKHWLAQTFTYLINQGVSPTNIPISLHYAAKPDWSDENHISLQLLSDGRLASQPLPPELTRTRVELKVGFPGFKLMSWNDNDKETQIMRIAA